MIFITSLIKEDFMTLSLAVVYARDGEALTWKEYMHTTTCTYYTQTV